jgi:hypothetical protein
VKTPENGEYMKGKRQLKASLIGMMLVLVAFVFTTNVGASQPPVADAGWPHDTYETETILYDGSGSYDPDFDSLLYRWDFNGDGIWDTNWDSNPYAEYTWLDDFHGFAILEVTDGTFIVSDTVEVTIGNIDPTILDISGPLVPVEVGTEVPVTVTFFDGDLRNVNVMSTDTFVAVFEWGDGTQSSIFLPSGSQVVVGTHVYTTAGVYTVTITLTDDDGGSTTGNFSFIVVYEPDVIPGTGFVTGGGWIYSNPGMYRPDPTLEGKVNFGFVAKYKKGQQIPTGNTEFNFHVADLNFHSSSYDWLIVAGDHAKYKGSGTINGEGDYGFMLMCIDGAHGNPDTFRMKIWDKTTGDMIYDNNGDTILGGGEIVIHQT